MSSLEKFLEYTFILVGILFGLSFFGGFSNSLTNEFTVEHTAEKPVVENAKVESPKDRVETAAVNGALISKRASNNTAEISYKEELSRVSSYAKVELPYVYPISGNFSISSWYGYRRDPFTGQRSFHRGIDISIRQGTPIRATGNGTVAEIGWDRYLGRFIRVNHNLGYQSIYGHLSRTAVRKGQRVGAGNTIGYSGNTGRSTGPHLHYQINRNEKSVNPVEVVNPLANI